MNYLETEIKVLNVNVEILKQKLEELNATQVFNGERKITYFDYPDSQFKINNIDFKLTEEGDIKLSYTSITDQGKETIKLRVSRKQEAIDLFAKLNLFPITEVVSHRTSYEWNGIDFDIDEFPSIPPFLEIDLKDDNEDINDILEKLNLTENRKGKFSTPEIYKLYNLDYFKILKK